MEYEIRELKKEDINEAFFNTLKDLSDSLKQDSNIAKQIFTKIKNNSNHKIFVALSKNKVIGLTTLLIERKFIKDFGKFGHIEDVVVKKEFRKQGIGGSLVKAATEAAKKLGCYQVRLCCSDVNMSFYKKQGYKKDGNSMTLNLK